MESIGPTEIEQQLLQNYLRTNPLPAIIPNQFHIFLPSEQIGINYPVRLRKDGEIEIVLDKEHPYAMGRYRVIIRAFEFYAKRIVAIQVLSLINDEIKSTAKREAFFLKKFRNVPGIVNTFHTFNYRDSEGIEMIEFVQQYYNLGNLEQSVQSAILSKDKIANDIFTGLKNIHAQGFIHQDLKPSNILLSSDSAVIADLDGLILKNKIVRISTSFAYIPPEIWEGRLNNLTDKEIYALYTEKSETWSLGCILYQLYTNRPLPWAEHEKNGLHFLDYSKYQIKEILKSIKNFTRSLPKDEKFTPLLQIDPKKRIF